MVGQVLRGLVAQDISGRRPSGSGYARSYQPGSYTFTAPYSGRYKFILHGPGGAHDGAGGGGSGAYVEKTMPMNANQTAGIVVGAARSTTNTTVTIAGHLVVTAGAANGSVAGVAANGDVMLHGTAGGAAGAAGSSGQGAGGGTGGNGGGSGGGSGAPGSADFPGGKGAPYANVQATGSTPGGGSAASSGLDVAPGGDGRVVVLLVG